MQLIKGLGEKQLIARIRKFDRLSALGERGLGFYLLDFEVRGLCRKHGFASTIQFACVKLQMARKRVGELLRMARALEDLPLIDAAFAKGEISWSAVRELTRIAMGETEAEWFDLARTSTLRQIERAVSGAQRGERPPSDPYTLSRTRLRVVAELSVEDHAVWQAAFERIALRAGPDLDASTALTELARTFLEQPITEKESAARQAFQVVWREQGGMTTVENEVSVCRTCHSLIHEGFLFVTGQAPSGLTWLGPDMKPVGLFFSHDVLGEPEYVKEIDLSGSRRAPRGARSWETRIPEGTTIDALDEVPDEVSAEWWRVHNHNFVFNGGRIMLKKKKRPRTSSA